MYYSSPGQVKIKEIHLSSSPGNEAIVRDRETRSIESCDVSTSQGPS